MRIGGPISFSGVLALGLTFAGVTAVAQDGGRATEVDAKRAQVEALLQSEYAARRARLDDLFLQIENERRELKALDEALAVLGIATPAPGIVPAPEPVTLSPAAEPIEETAPEAVAVVPQNAPAVPKQPVASEELGSVEPIALMDDQGFDAALRDTASLVKRLGNSWHFYYRGLDMKADLERGSDKLTVSSFVRFTSRVSNKKRRQAFAAVAQDGFTDSGYIVREDRIFAYYNTALADIQAGDVQAMLDRVTMLTKNFGQEQTRG